MTVTENSNVKVHYTGRLEDNTVFDSSEGRDPLAVELGKGLLIPGFEKGLHGLKVGEKKTITIPSSEAYGPVRNEMTQEVDKQYVPEGVQVGQQLTAEGPQGPMVVTVAEVKENSVVLDGNHPLAGKDLIFDLEVVEVA
jgi:FKBP-type peptidyl-prolyl cis-trans isomerase SlpA